MSSSAVSQSGYSTAMTSNMTDEDRRQNVISSPAANTTHAQPRLTLLELLSNSASASALPDSFDFNISRKGQYVAVYSASNIWLIQTVQLPRLFARTLQVKRKPIAIDITSHILTVYSYICKTFHVMLPWVCRLADNATPRSWAGM